MGWGETNINITFENDEYKILPHSTVHPCNCSWREDMATKHNVCITFKSRIPRLFFSNVKRHCKSILLVCGYKSSKTQISTIVLISLTTRQMQFVSMYFPMSEYTHLWTHTHSHTHAHMVVTNVV